MAEINIPAGPIDTPPYRAIVRVGRELHSDANATALHQVLNGLELGAWDRQVLEWLAVYKPATVATIASWIERARALAPADSIVLDEPAELGLTWHDGGDLLVIRDKQIVLWPGGADEYGMDAAEAREWATQLAAMAKALDEQQAGEAR